MKAVSLSYKLALSHLLIILLFVAVLVGLVPLLSPYFHMLLPLNWRAQPPHERHFEQLRALASGWRGRLEDLGPLPREGSLFVFWTQGDYHHLSGPEFSMLPPPPGVFEGKSLIVFERERGLNVFEPLCRGGRVEAVLAGTYPLPESPIGRGYRSHATHGLLIASLLAAALCFGAGYLVSPWLVRPLRQLRSAFRRFGPEQPGVRLESLGPGEFEELQTAFNEMAARLEEALRKERTEAERAQQLESAQRRFLADVSHNLGTPLAAVQGWLDLWLDGLVKDPEESRKLLSKARREVMYVSRTVVQLLELARWSSANPVLQWQDFVLLEAVMEVVDTLEEPATARNIDLEFRGLDPHLAVRADRTRLKEVVQILLENCVEHSGQGTRVIVEAQRADDRVNVSIRDNGPGLPGAVLDWWQAGCREHAPGLSLGLAIARRLCESHGGPLQIDSGPDGLAMVFGLRLSEKAGCPRPEAEAEGEPGCDSES